MKLSKWFVVLVIVLFLLMILVDSKMPQKFKWDSTYEHLDKQPFGCWVFDSVMTQSVPQGYSLTNNTFYQLAKQPATELRTYLYASGSLSKLDSLEFESMKKVIANGNHLILATEDYWSWYSDNIQSTFGFSLAYGNFSEYRFMNQYIHPDYSELRDTITWFSDSSYSKATYGFNSGVTSMAIQELTSKAQVLAVTNYSVDHEDYCDTIAIKMKYGKGELELVAVPLIFTNYGVLDPQMRAMAMRVLTQAGSLPIVRIDPHLTVGDVAEGGRSQSPLRYLLANRPLRWALYLSILTLFLGFFFTARRRQRVIPVYEQPSNKAMDLVRHIGTLYYQRHDNVDLLNKKYRYFTETLRRKAMVDIDDEDHFMAEVDLLTQITGIKVGDLTDMLTEIQQATVAAELSDNSLKALMDKMNQILQKI